MVSLKRQRQTRQRQTKEVRSKQSWVCLQHEELKRETESLIVAAQNQSVRTNLEKRLTKARKTCYADCVRKLMKVWNKYKRRHGNLVKIVH